MVIPGYIAKGMDTVKLFHDRYINKNTTWLKRWSIIIELGISLRGKYLGLKEI